MSFIPTKDGSFFNWVFNRERISQSPIVNFMVSTLGDRETWSMLKITFFDGDYDHVLSGICQHGLVFVDDGWICWITSGLAEAWNATIGNELFPGFLLSWKVLLYIFLFKVWRDFKW